MAYLKYDTEKMESVKTTYNACVADMDAIQSKMQTMVDEVRDAWKSEAGDAFFDKYDNEWLKGFKQYKEVLQHMAENLDVASGRYSEVTQQADALRKGNAKIPSYFYTFPTMPILTFIRCLKK